MNLLIEKVHEAAEAINSHPAHFCQTIEDEYIQTQDNRELHIQIDPEMIKAVEV